MKGGCPRREIRCPAFGKYSLSATKVLSLPGGITFKVLLLSSSGTKDGLCADITEIVGNRACDWRARSIFRPEDAHRNSGLHPLRPEGVPEDLHRERIAVGGEQVIGPVLPFGPSDQNPAKPCHLSFPGAPTRQNPSSDTFNFCCKLFSRRGAGSQIPAHVGETVNCATPSTNHEPAAVITAITPRIPPITASVIVIGNSNQGLASIFSATKPRSAPSA
jgi:hypothetical protein